MQMMGTDGGCKSFFGFVESACRVSRSSKVLAPFAIAWIVSDLNAPNAFERRLTKAMIFAPSVKLPAPRVTNKSALTLEAS